MYKIIWFFFIYSFLGWLLECIYAAIKNKSFVNRGVLGGPLCCIYGVFAVANTVLFSELKNHMIFLFLGSSILFGVCEWLIGKCLEHIYQKKWWNYSKCRYNIDGYVSIYSAALGGCFGVISVKWLNSLFYTLFSRIPTGIGYALLTCLLVLLIIDAACTYIYLRKLPQRYKQAHTIHHYVSKFSARLNEWIIRHVQKRIDKAYPQAKNRQKPAAKTVFAEGCSFCKLFWLFFIGAFLGDVVETLFCRLTTGIWMSRSSLVWGPFSVVWGLGIAGATWILYNYREKSDGAVFVFGTLLGGAFEYACSVFTELVFGQVFWDYSQYPFNLGGRINLLYCFFWGIAAVVWLKKLYPRISGWIEKIPMKIGNCLTVFLVIFMVADALVSSAALVRYGERSEDKSATNAVAEWIDNHYPDEKMEKIYPNSILK